MAEDPYWHSTRNVPAKKIGERKRSLQQSEEQKKRLTKRVMLHIQLVKGVLPKRCEVIGLFISEPCKLREL
jgi:hypothetical protein